MTNTFSKIFSLQLSHTYYANEICNDIQYVASSETESMTRKFSLKLRILSNGFELYNGSGNTLKELLNYISQTTENKSFNFYATVVNPRFYNVSKEFPVQELGYLQYDSQNNTSGIIKGTFNSTSNPQEALQIKIQFNDLIQENNTVSEFKIHIETKATQWRYYIVNNSQMELGTLQIGGNAPYQFNSQENTTLQDGTKAILISSGTQKIPLQEVAKYKLSLENIQNGRTSQVFTGLPMANPNNITLFQENGTPQIASPIYVYI